MQKLFELVKTAFRAGQLMHFVGDRSALTAEQLAAVEAKYPDHRKTLYAKRVQKFCKAVDNVVKHYRELEEATK